MEAAQSQQAIETSNAIDWVSSVPSFIIFALTTILVIVGWRVIYRNAKKIARRTEVKSHLDTVDNALYDLLHEALHFYKRVEADIPLAIKGNFPLMDYEQKASLYCSRIDKVLKHLKNYQLTTQPPTELSHKLRSLATSAPSLIQTKNQTERAHIFWGWFMELRGDCDNLSEQLKESFVKQFLK